MGFATRWAQRPSHESRVWGKRGSAKDAKCAKESKKPSSRDGSSAATPILRVLHVFIPWHQGSVGSAPSALDPTYAHARAGWVKRRPLLCIRQLLLRCATSGILARCSGGTGEKPLRLLRPLRTPCALRCSRVPSYLAGSAFSSTNGPCCDEK